MSCIFHFDSCFISNSGKFIAMIKTRYELFKYIGNEFLQHIARGIISCIITVNAQWNQDNNFDKLLQMEFLLIVFLFFLDQTHFIRHSQNHYPFYHLNKF